MAPYYTDDGVELNPDLFPKPQLCFSCAKDDDPNEEILCNLTRLDENEAPEFICFAYENKYKK
ncbi:hypothetical protein [Williamwhitmania taraxaci]|uniref:Uncharacterized protein n=1 Tax=Williamwhitmania taraxaci TaxID=1640674 RepID=A0A1G6MJ32_9BACT|nr:hypothetical protein [Williamwhitmania taraxaci]SDC54975.1 hypothetical protein SAMN05216323_103612 [Williamwhitmania taraxaci]